MGLLKATDIKKAQLEDITVEVVNVKGKKVVALDRLREEHTELYASLLETSGGYTYLKLT
jgi:hypothetical protein